MKKIKVYVLVFLCTLIMASCGENDSNTTKSTQQISVETEIQEQNNQEQESEFQETEIVEEIEQIEEKTENSVETVSTTLILETSYTEATIITSDSIPAYEGYACVVINGNEPYFSDSDKIRTDAFETYSNLDSLCRCGVAYANICKEIMPSEKRGEIGSVKPSGWHTIKYPEQISDRYLYNRCHLIGYQLAGENANAKNLITGTRYLNIEGMLPLENAVDSFVEKTGYHVLYRVTPMFTDNELVARGVLMEAFSVEDGGMGLQFCYYCYNVQPGIGIDYATGDSWVDENSITAKETTVNTGGGATVVSEKQRQEAERQAEEQRKAEEAAKAEAERQAEVERQAEAEQQAEAQSQVAESGNVTVPQQAESEGNLVWVPTNGGTKYHTNAGCSNMKDPIQVTLETAEANGYTPCKRCH